MIPMADPFQVAAQFYDADYAALDYHADTPFYVEPARAAG
jgi:hypothetical protein